ncbi:inositol monophosphatase, partial [Klebsiella pneumoniae]
MLSESRTMTEAQRESLCALIRQAGAHAQA